MLRLSQKQCAAVEAVVHIACYAFSDSLSGKALAEAIGQPPRYLEPMLQQLVHAGILRGIRGPKGGYVLAMERRRITVRAICAALGDEEEELKRNSPLGNVLVMPLYQDALDAALSTLEKVDIEQLCRQAQEQQQLALPKKKPDFTI